MKKIKLALLSLAFLLINFVGLVINGATTKPFQLRIGLWSQMTSNLYVTTNSSSFIPRYNHELIETYLTTSCNTSELETYYIEYDTNLVTNNTATRKYVMRSGYIVNNAKQMFNSNDFYPLTQSDTYYVTPIVVSKDGADTFKAPYDNINIYTSTNFRNFVFQKQIPFYYDKFNSSVSTSTIINDLKSQIGNIGYDNFQLSTTIPTIGISQISNIKLTADGTYTNLTNWFNTRQPVNYYLILNKVVDEPKVANVTFYSNASGVSNMPETPQEVPIGTKLNSIVKSNPIKQYYNFLGWSTTTEKANIIPSDYTINNDISLYAIWEQKQCTINFYPNAEGVSGMPESPQIVPAGTLLRDVLDYNKGYRAPTKELNEFIGWSTTTSINNVVDSEYIITENTNFYAIWNNLSGTFPTFTINISFTSIDGPYAYKYTGVYTGSSLTISYSGRELYQYLTFGFSSNFVFLAKETNPNLITESWQSFSIENNETTIYLYGNYFQTLDIEGSTKGNMLSDNYTNLSDLPSNTLWEFKTNENNEITINILIRYRTPSDDNIQDNINSVVNPLLNLWHAVQPILNYKIAGIISISSIIYTMLAIGLVAFAFWLIKGGRG